MKYFTISIKMKCLRNGIIHEDKEFYYNEKDYNRYQRMKESTAIEFMGVRVSGGNK